MYVQNSGPKLLLVYAKENRSAHLGWGGGENFHGKRRFRCQKQPLKIPTPKLGTSSSVARLAPENRFYAYISINMSLKRKLQDTPNIPHKISYMIVPLKVSLGLLVRQKIR